ncbi:MAG: alkaline phosphatase [Planctomycetia bacterium]|nr:alkaline phosphatase [Planctomycetia bacterium]
MRLPARFEVRFGCLLLLAIVAPAQADHVRDLQETAVKNKQAEWGHWGRLPEVYSDWTSHSNRLIPVYTFGITLDAFDGEKSAYRQPDQIKQLYGRIPDGTVNSTADYCDQTDVYRLQKLAAASGKKHVILVVFDGMDWWTTWAASVNNAGRVGYSEGRGTGLFWQDYAGTQTDFGYFVTSPWNQGLGEDVDAQTILDPDGKLGGGYDPTIAGDTPWSLGTDPGYVIAQCRARPHAVTDSASSATSMTSGIKTFNASINVKVDGSQVETIAHQLQREGYAVGVVTSVPISHATPAAAYSHNVSRDDFQDLTRDLLGLRSIAHRNEPLPGVDVLIGAGWGEDVVEDSGQGKNLVPGNRYVTADDLAASDATNGGRYTIAQRTSGRAGTDVLTEGVRQAKERQSRFFGYFGTRGGHLPFQTADGDYRPTIGAKGVVEKYSEADVSENPKLADMTRAALEVLDARSDKFWLMVESGDVDWANHDDNIDNSIGAVKSGDAAFRAIAEWAEAGNHWEDTAVILTADHGHYLVITDPQSLIEPTATKTGE